MQLLLLLLLRDCDLCAPLLRCAARGRLLLKKLQSQNLRLAYPMVVMKLGVKLSSLKRSSRQLLPTPGGGKARSWRQRPARRAADGSGCRPPAAAAPRAAAARTHRNHRCCACSGGLARGGGRQRGRSSASLASHAHTARRQSRPSRAPAALPQTLLLTRVAYEQQFNQGIVVCSRPRPHFCPGRCCSGLGTPPAPLAQLCARGASLWCDRLLLSGLWRAATGERLLPTSCRCFSQGQRAVERAGAVK